MAFLSAAMVMVLTGRLHDAVLYGQLPVAKIFLVAGIVLFWASRGGSVLAIAMKTLPARGFIALTAALYLSVPFSLWKGLSAEMATKWTLSSLPIVLIVSTSIRSVGDLERLLRALVLMVLASTALILLGQGIAIDTAAGPRLSLAGSYDPNDFAAVIAATSSVCVWALRDRGWFWKVLGYLGLACCGFLIVKTGSRGGAITLGAVLAGTTLFLPRSMPRVARLGIGVSMIAGIAFAPSSFLDRLATLNDVTKDYNYTENSGRIAVWKRGFGYFAGSPITGVGVGAFPVADGQWSKANGYVRGFKWSVAHNLFIETASELGLPGLIALLFSLLPVVFTWRRVRKLQAVSEEDERLKRVIETIALSTLAFLLATMFINGLFNPLLLMLVAMSIGAHTLLKHKSKLLRPT
jgi:O-antigen ligase